MKLSFKRILLWSLLLLLALFAISVALNYDVIRRTMLGGVKVYETVPPKLPARPERRFGR